MPDNWPQRGRRRVVLCGRVLTLIAQREFIDLVPGILKRNH